MDSIEEGLDIVDVRHTHGQIENIFVLHQNTNLVLNKRSKENYRFLPWYRPLVSSICSQDFVSIENIEPILGISGP